MNVPSGSEAAFKSHYEWKKFFADNTGNGALTASPSTLRLVMNDSKSFNLSLIDYANYRSVQFDIVLPTGASIPDGGIKYNTACSSKHSMTSEKISSNRYRVILLSSASSSAFTSGTNIFTIDVTTDGTFRWGNIVVNGIVLTNVNLTEKEPASVTVTTFALTPVTKVEVSPSSAEFYVGESTNLTATVSQTTATYKTLTWSSSNTSVATVDDSGKVTGVGAGTATITATATDGSGVKGTASVTIKSKVMVSSITLNTASATIERTKTMQLSATVKPTNATNAALNWTSSNTSVATVSATGLVTGVKAGTATITATAADGSGKSASASITVTGLKVTSLSITPSSTSVYVVSTTTLSTTISPSNADNKTLTWTSSNTAVATVNNGVVTGVKAGTVTIKATTSDGSNKSATSTVTVLPVKATSISVSPASKTIEKGATVTLSATVSPSNATDKSVTWSSNNTAVATVDASGKVTGKSAGSAVITATANDGSGVKGTATITVTNYIKTITISATSLTLEMEKTTQLSASYSPADADNATLTWSSNNENVATVTANGFVTAVGVGNTSITVSNAQTGVSASCDVTVTDYLYGDSDDDGLVTNSDLMTSVFYILEKNPSPFSFKKADVNQNNVVNVTDLTLTVDIILTVPHTVMYNNTRPYAPARLESNIRLSDVTLDENGYGSMFVTLNTIETLCSMQADIELPAGLHIDAIELCNERFTDHTLAWAQVDDAVTRFIIYSFTIEEITGDDAPMLRVDFSADPDYENSVVNINNILAVDDSCHKFGIRSANCEVANNAGSGIVSSETDSVEVSSSRSNIIVNGPAGKKAHIFNVTGHLLSEFETTGYDVRNVVPGIYIVLVDNSSFKVSVE